MSIDTYGDRNLTQNEEMMFGIRPQEFNENEEPETE